MLLRVSRPLMILLMLSNVWGWPIEEFQNGFYFGEHNLLRRVENGLGHQFDPAFPSPIQRVQLCICGDAQGAASPSETILQEQSSENL